VQLSTRYVPFPGIGPVCEALDDREPPGALGCLFELDRVLRELDRLEGALVDVRGEQVRERVALGEAQLAQDGFVAGHRSSCGRRLRGPGSDEEGTATALARVSGAPGVWALGVPSGLVQSEYDSGSLVIGEDKRCGVRLPPAAPADG